MVNAGDEKGGGAPGVETVGFDPFRRDMGDVVDGGSGATELEGDLARGDVMGALGRVVVAVQGTVGGCMVLEEVVNTTLDGADRAEGGIAGDAMAEGLPAGAVLLISVGERHVGPLLHVIPRTGICGDALDGGTAEGSVSEVEGLASATIGGRGEGVFPGSAEEIEGEGAQVQDGLGPWLVGGLGEGGDQGSEDGDVDRPDPRRGRVLIRPSLEEGLEAEDIMGAFQPGIREAQSGERLSHGTEGFRHTLSSDRLRAAGEQASAVAAGKNNEEFKMDVRWDIAEVGVLLE